MNNNTTKQQNNKKSDNCSKNLKTRTKKDWSAMPLAKQKKDVKASTAQST